MAKTSLKWITATVLLLSLVLSATNAPCAQSSNSNVAPGKKPSGSTASNVNADSGTLAHQSFGRAETVSGTINMISNNAGVVVLTLAAKTPPKTLSVETQQYDTVEGNKTVHHRKTMTVSQVDDVDYAFRVTDSTHIWLEGRRIGLSDLQGLKSKTATVRFTPEAIGDFAEVIQIH